MEVHLSPKAKRLVLANGRSTRRIRESTYQYETPDATCFFACFWRRACFLVCFQDLRPSDVISVVTHKLETQTLRSLLIMFALVGLGTRAHGQAPAPQSSRTLLQFLKPGDLVGVQSVDGTMSVAISIYTKEQFEVAKLLLSRGRSIRKAKQLAAENDTVSRALDQYVSQQLDPSLAVEQLSVMPLIRTSLGKITEVGADYVLIELDGSQSRRCVIAKPAIGRIYLDATPIRFFGSRRVANVNNE